MRKAFLLTTSLMLLGSCNSNKFVYQRQIQEEALFPYSDLYDSTLSVYHINHRENEAPSYLHGGKFRNKDLSDMKINEVFSDWEILMIIKRMEGYSDSSSDVAVSHNNPGNIKFGKLAKKFGASKGKKETYYGENDHYAKFPNDSLGDEAALELIRRITKKDPTIKQFFRRWSSEEGSLNYCAFVNSIAKREDYPLD